MPLGQLIASEALARIWELIQGQLWLVNALGYETCFHLSAGQDRRQPITVEIVDDAKENLILRRDTCTGGIIRCIPGTNTLPLATFPEPADTRQAGQ